MTARKLSALLLFALGLAGCSSIISSLLDPYPSQEEQQKFLAELDAQLLPDRERCRRIQQFHAEWAKTFSECRAFLDSLAVLEKAAKEGKVEIRVPEVKK